MRPGSPSTRGEKILSEWGSRYTVPELHPRSQDGLKRQQGSGGAGDFDVWGLGSPRGQGATQWGLCVAVTGQTHLGVFFALREWRKLQLHVLHGPGPGACGWGGSGSGSYPARPTLGLPAAEKGRRAGGPEGWRAGSGLTTNTRRLKGPSDSGGDGGDSGEEEGWAAHTRPPCCCRLPPPESPRPSGRTGSGTSKSPTTVSPASPRPPRAAPANPSPRLPLARPPRPPGVSAPPPRPFARAQTRGGRGLGEATAEAHRVWRRWGCGRREGTTEGPGKGGGTSQTSSALSRQDAIPFCSIRTGKTS